MNHLATFTLGFLIGSLTLHTLNRQQEDAEIKRLEAWAEAQAGPGWDGEDPLPAELIGRRPTNQLSTQRFTDQAHHHPPGQEADEIKQPT